MPQIKTSGERYFSGSLKVAYSTAGLFIIKKSVF
jgi:hypothetical protein